MENLKNKQERKEMINKLGILVVLTGASGAGKDGVMDGFMENPVISDLGFQKIVTSTDRPPRPGERDGRDYHFVSKEELVKMEKEGELVEPITATGSSNKGTTKKEIERLFSGESLIWRIDPSRAAEVASGDFFKRLFPEDAKTLQKQTIVLFITASRQDIEARRRNRDKDGYDPKEYELRDNQEKQYLEVLSENAISIENAQNKLNETINKTVKITANFFDEIKKNSKNK